MAYFGCLTKIQANRYLYSADANLILAVTLVQHDLGGEEPPLDLESESDRIQAALKWAATKTGHPSPSTLAQLMAIRLQDADLHIVQKVLSGKKGIPLTAEDVRGIHRIFLLMMSPLLTMSPFCVANRSDNNNELLLHVRRNLNVRWCGTTSSNTEGTSTTTFCWVGNPISSLLIRHGPFNKLQDCLRIAGRQLEATSLKIPCRSGEFCDYLESLKMHLLGMIHNYYITALKLLPPKPLGSEMSEILMAGHCYGSMNPVSNIIVNSIWQITRGYRISESERGKIDAWSDILDPLSLLRTEVHSLRGLMRLAAFDNRQILVEACALENLCSAKCNVMVPLARIFENNPFYEAAVAAGHPHPDHLAKLHEQLLSSRPVERNALVSLITKAQSGGYWVHLEDISLIMDRMSSPDAPASVHAPELCADAWRVVSRKRSEYEKRRSWLRSQIEQVLKDYTKQHFWEPKYELNIILGVEESNEGPPCFDICYHVNFLATSDLRFQRTLFFAEFWFSDQRKPKFCCPLPYARAGRCYYGVHTARKIVYPDDAKYIPGDITENGTDSVDGILEMDLVYFSPEMDVELAKKL